MSALLEMFLSEAKKDGATKIDNYLKSTEGTFYTSLGVVVEFRLIFNPLRPNNDVSQTSHCNIKGVSVSEVMRIENMITQVQFY